LNRLEPRLSGLPPETKARVEEITRLIVEKLLLTPTERLKSINDETMALTYADALNRLFSLAEQEHERHESDTETPARKVSSR
jgi:glutamyl-tRNA reductase